MTRNFRQAIIISALLASTLIAADKKTDFSGNWIFDPGKSETQLSEPRGLNTKVKMSVGIGVGVQTSGDEKPQNLRGCRVRRYVRCR